MKTIAEPRVPLDADVRRVDLDVAGRPSSGLLATPVEGPVRALVVAVHGGGVNAHYFHGAAHSDVSLLRLGARLGFSVLAVDRPGYGPHSVLHPGGMRLTDQADRLGEILAHLRTHQQVGAGIFLLAHSFGSKVALLRASAESNEDLLGVDVSGVGHRYAGQAHPGGALAPRSRWMYNWGGLDLYPPGTFQGSASMISAMPARELEDAASWPSLFDAVAGRIRVPLRMTFAEHEHWWCHEEETLADLSERLEAVPRLVIERQPGAGHNISLGWSARAYHLRALAFAEECLEHRRV